MSRRSDVSTGFTLIELLVSISIIALLVAILLPALGRARQAAQDLQCLTAQRQLGIGMAVYTGDYQQTFPPYETGTGASLRTYASLLWSHEVFTSGQIFECPRLEYDFPDSFRELTPVVGPTSYLFRHVHMGYNYSNLGSSFRLLGSSHPDWRRPIQVDQVLRPAKTYLTMDSFVFNGIDSRGYHIVSDQLIPASGVQFGPDTRHGARQTVNALYVDGHASSISVTDPLSPHTSGLTRFTDAQNHWVGR